MPAAAVPEGTMTWGVHITLASRWLDPAETALSHCCGQMRRRDMLEKIPVQLRNAGAAEIGDRTADLFAVQLDCPRRAGFSRDRRAPKCWAADHDELRPDRERLHDIAAAAKATVHNNGGPASYGVDNRRQDIDRRHRAVEIPAAMIGDDDTIGAVRDRALGIKRRKDTFHKELAGPHVAQYRKVFPGKRVVLRLSLGRRHVRNAFLHFGWVILAAGHAGGQQVAYDNVK